MRPIAFNEFVHSLGLLLLDGGSCGGKTTVAKALAARDSRVRFLPPYTDRKPRAEDIDEDPGVVCVTDDEFDSYVAEPDAVWYCKGSSRVAIRWEDLEATWQCTPVIALTVSDINAIFRLNAMASKRGAACVSVYLNVPEDIRRRRALRSGLSPEAANTRIAREGLAHRHARTTSPIYNAVIENEVLEQTTCRLMAIVNELMGFSAAA